jgi:hypothetical protein
VTLPLSANLPLRTSAVWGVFGEVETIPHRYGRNRGRAIRYDNSGRRYVWADHASELVTGVRVDGQVTRAWVWRNTQDVTGHPVTMIELSQPTTGEITAEGFGKINASTGARIDNPADIITDILTQIADRDAPNTAWLGYEAAKLGITCAGTLDDADASIQSAVTAICESIGALWASRARQFARIHPGGLFEGGSTAADESGQTFDLADLIEATTDITDIVNAVVVEFDHRDGKASQTIELDCPDSVARFGRREQRIDAPWIADARVANAVAERLLTYRAEPSWQYRADQLRGDVRTLDVVHWTGATRLPTPESAIVLAAKYDPGTDRSAIELERLTATGAELRLVRQGSAIEDDQVAQVTVQTQADQRRIQIKDTTGAPIAKAKVLLDGTITRYSDAGGWVVFPVHATPPGIHTLTITTEAGETLTMSLLIQ